MMPESQNSGAGVNVHLLCNDSVITFPRQRIRKQQLRYCWAIKMEIVFSVGSGPRLYTEDPRPADRIIECVS
jgi:hypothetical protein